MTRSPVALLVAIVIALVVRVASQDIRTTDEDVQALLHAGLYERAETAARAAFERVRGLRGERAPEVAAAADLLVRALVLNGKGSLSDTLDLARQALDIKESTLGTSHHDLVRSLVNLADALYAEAEYNDAIAVAERAVALSDGTKSEDRSLSLESLGNAFTQAGAYDDAIRVLEQSLSLRESGPLGSPIDVARTLEATALAHQRKGDYKQSGRLIRRAASIHEELTVEHPGYVGTLNALAQQLWFEGNLIESRKVSLQAVSLSERLLRADHPTTARALRYLAGTVFYLGDLGEAHALWSRALGMAERSFGPAHLETAGYLHDVALAELEQGDYAKARARFERALAILEQRFGSSHDFVANTLHNLSIVEARLGDFKKARQEQQRAIAIWTHVFGPDHPFVALALTELATVHREEGAAAEALPLLERALTAREKALGTEHRDVAVTLADLASTLMQLGRPARAHTLVTRSLRIWAQLGTPDAPEYATALSIGAELEANRGKYTEARDYYQRAMAIRAKVYSTGSPNYADAQAGYALATANLGDRTSALKNAVDAEQTSRNHLRTVLRSLPERQSLNYAAVRPKGLNLILSLTLSSSERADVAMDSVVRSRAIVLDEMATRRHTQESATDDPLRNAFITAQQRLANLLVRGPGQLSAAQYVVALDDARAESEHAEQTLAERSAEFRAERGRAQHGLDDVRAALPSDGVLLSFVRYERTRFREPTVSGPTSAAAPSPSAAVPSYLAFVVRAQGPVAVVALGPTRVIDPLVAQWRNDIREEAAPARASSTALRPKSRASGVALRRLIWDPVAPFLMNANRIFIVPDGSLNLVPFVALPVGQRSYLIEHAPVIHYESSERDLIAAPMDDGPAEQGLLAVGGPAFDDTTLFGSARAAPPVPSGRRPTQMVTRSGVAPCYTSSGMQGTFSPLGGTLKEVRDLASVWNMSARSRSEASRVLVGQDASEPALKKEAHRYRVLHLATHGFFLGDSCLPGTANTRAVGGLATATAHRPASGMANPLLLSGLALAGANRRGAAQPGEDDGILTAEEVATLDLGGVEWAVLSACDTGLGQIRVGEGVLGLRRAFQIAGAKTVIMSLWSVDDHATREWMVTLYEGRFQKQLSTADAVHGATIAMLRDRRAKGLSTTPFYWAAFVAAGDWR